MGGSKDEKVNFYLHKIDLGIASDCIDFWLFVCAFFSSGGMPLDHPRSFSFSFQSVPMPGV